MLGFGICSEAGGLVRHAAQMLTKWIFLLTKRFLTVSRASDLLHSFIPTMGGLCSAACWRSLLFLGGYSEIKGPIYLQRLCCCRMSFLFGFSYLEENDNLGGAALKVRISARALWWYIWGAKLLYVLGQKNDETVLKRILCSRSWRKISDLFCLWQTGIRQPSHALHSRERLLVLSLSCNYPDRNEADTLCTARWVGVVSLTARLECVRNESIGTPSAKSVLARIRYFQRKDEI